VGGGHFRGRVIFGASPWWWGPGYPYGWWEPPPDYVALPPTAVEEEHEYIERQPAQDGRPPEGQWYYCPSTESYYPYVQTCDEPWVPVAPRPP
jgi:hypothetical protein